MLTRRCDGTLAKAIPLIADKNSMAKLALLILIIIIPKAYSFSEVVSDDFQALIEKLDPEGNARPRPDVKSEKLEGKTYKSLRLNSGLQLHPSCVKESERFGNNTALLKSMMEIAINDVAAKLIKCSKSYPELSSIIGESISQLRRQILKCKQDAEDDYGSYDIFSNTITFEGRTFIGLINSSDSSPRSTLFHELLHGTSCNNRHDHNQIQTIASSYYSSKDTCKENVTLDRVSVVESLCMGENLNFSDSPAQIILAKRMNMCGDDYGCKRIFTSKGNNYSSFDRLRIKSSDLSEDMATKLCSRIKDDGMCEHLKKTQGGSISYSHLAPVYNKIQQKLKTIMPGHTNKISAELLEILPNIKLRFSEMKNNKCFKRNFYFDPSGSLHALRTKNTSVQFTSFSGHIAQIREDFQHYSLKTDSECSKEYNQINSVLSEMIYQVGDNPLFEQAEDLRLDIIYRYLPRANVLNNKNSPLYKFLGKDLVGEYLSQSDKFHYKSPNFDCIAAGLTPFRAIEASSLKFENQSCEER